MDIQYMEAHLAKLKANMDKQENDFFEIKHLDEKLTELKAAYASAYGFEKYDYNAPYAILTMKLYNDYDEVYFYIEVDYKVYTDDGEEMGKMKIDPVDYDEDNKMVCRVVDLALKHHEYMTDGNTLVYEGEL